MKQKFKVGDRVRFVKSGKLNRETRDWAQYTGYVVGEEYIVCKVYSDNDNSIRCTYMGAMWIDPDHFEKVINQKESKMEIKTKCEWIQRFMEIKNEVLAKAVDKDIQLTTKEDIDCLGQWPSDHIDMVYDNVRGELENEFKITADGSVCPWCITNETCRGCEYAENHDGRCGDESSPYARIRERLSLIRNGCSVLSLGSFSIVDALKEQIEAFDQLLAPWEKETPLGEGVVEWEIKGAPTVYLKLENNEYYDVPFLVICDRAGVRKAAGYIARFNPDGKMELNNSLRDEAGVQRSVNDNHIETVIN